MWTFQQSGERENINKYIYTCILAQDVKWLELMMPEWTPITSEKIKKSILKQPVFTPGKNAM